MQRADGSMDCLPYDESAGGYGKDTGDAGSPTGGSSRRRRGRLRHGAAHDADGAPPAAGACCWRCGCWCWCWRTAPGQVAGQHSNGAHRQASQHTGRQARRDVAGRRVSPRVPPRGRGGREGGGSGRGSRLGRCPSCAASPHAQAFEANSERQGCWAHGQPRGDGQKAVASGRGGCCWCAAGALLVLLLVLLAAAAPEGAMTSGRPGRAQALRRLAGVPSGSPCPCGSIAKRPVIGRAPAYKDARTWPGAGSMRRLW